jgi:predicted RNA-binding protein with PUA-like domain
VPIRVSEEAQQANKHANIDIARNNLRSMKEGDLAFFYHSSCKVPAIVGIMEIVKEHSPDRKALSPFILIT